jgi:hypothetical protein
VELESGMMQLTERSVRGNYIRKRTKSQSEDDCRRFDLRITVLIMSANKRDPFACDKASSAVWTFSDEGAPFRVWLMAQAPVFDASPRSGPGVFLFKALDNNPYDSPGGTSCKPASVRFS